MPLNETERALLGRPREEDVDQDHQRIDYAPREKSKIGRFTLVALILNRTIGSGIFLSPHRVLAGTGCVGGALCMWILAAVISICGLYVWLECGLSMPQRLVRGENKPRGVPRSGGEKNYLEFMFPNHGLRLPHIRTTCAFSIMFIVMYNLSANAIACALQALRASGYYQEAGDDPARGVVLGVAIGMLTMVVVFHSFSRNIGIWINNCFAAVKIALLLAIICLGVAKAAGRFGGPGNVVRNNFTRDVWTTQRTDIASWSNALMLCLFSFGGYRQPFYVLAEAKRPRKYFPKYTISAMVIVALLFLLVNISYLLVVDKEEILSNNDSLDLATLFFDRLWSDGEEKASRAMAVITAISIFGNLWVMTFTASRVKQEIAKEGILPYSLFFATSYRTPYGLWQQWKSRDRMQPDEVEQAPTAALSLHWATSILQIAVTAAIVDPKKAYAALVSLYMYTIILGFAFWVSVGLILTKTRDKTKWRESRRYRPWLSPIHVLVYGISSAFLLIVAFVPAAEGSPFHDSVTGIPWYIIPSIGVTAPFWGVLWYWGFLFYQAKIRREQLIVTRQPYWTQDPDCPGEYVQLAEVIDHTWEIPIRAGDLESSSQESVSDRQTKVRSHAREILLRNIED
ncbi:hypothetical protein CERZMDRAFT_107794 [Cercospora zeae-maydis SCOH1-5]|uniref:Amino acid permease/ SLC12A domain-containing protein n=1 Tax=Cercospora zeae-maydis SCOH1-5 TaxID=717836 RepID=A0A6A6F2J0_9PEZI|nr:hypothetical protein CERZMDRAFT_107794 [Cercospora zeae-maydis SCOH1-5]